MNANLNLGGLLGAILGLSIIAAWAYCYVDFESGADAPYRLGVTVFIGCAVGGNTLFAVLFPKKQNDE